MRNFFIIFGLIFSICQPSLATTILPSTASNFSYYGPAGTFMGSTGSVNDLTNGVVLPEATQWNSAGAFAWEIWDSRIGTGSNHIQFDLGGIFRLEDIKISVDNNDTYLMKTSVDGTSWTTLFTISPSDGEISWGLDTFSSSLGDPEYEASIDFAPTNARYARLSAGNGDRFYSISEVTFLGTPVNTVPEPNVLMLLGLALVGFFGHKRFGKT